jgi:hypothetical protein
MSTIGASELVESRDNFVVIDLDIKLELKISSFYLAVFDIVFYLSLGVSICLDVISIEISISTPKKS